MVCEVVISEYDIENAIHQISMGAASGPDGVPPVLLKKCVRSLKMPLRLMWQKSIELAQIPDLMKLGLVVPVFKNGERCEAKNYRPVTLTSHLIKVCERVVVRKLVMFMEERCLFNPGQHGFRANRSCLSQLLDNYQHILNIMETGSGADVIYLDFAKAFDKVDHGILMRKLIKIGIGGAILRWIHEFLKDRNQVVRVQNIMSDPANVVSGVPQGTVLGPILFLIFIGDIDEEIINAHASSFADDTRVLLSVSCDDDMEKMQTDLNVIYNWSDCNNMQFNGCKFEHLRYGSFKDAGGRNCQYLSPTGDTIATASDVKDLGIVMSCTGGFDSHIKERSEKGSQMGGWILRTFATRNSRPMMILFKALVLPIMEYCCQLWSPKQLNHIRKIESVQRHFTSKLEGMSGLSYWDRLAFLNIYSLERRRERYVIMYIWKIIQKLAPNLLGNDRVTSYVNLRRGRLCNVPSLNRGAPMFVQTLRENSFSVRGPALFNSIPKDIRDFDGSLATFKRRLDKFLATVPDRPMLLQYYQCSASNGLVDQLAQMRVESSMCP